MTYEVKVGRTNRVIETNESGQIERIDETHVSDIEWSDVKECAFALSEHLINEGYLNSQDLAGLDDREALRVDRYIDERRGK